MSDVRGSTMTMTMTFAGDRETVTIQRKAFEDQCTDHSIAWGHGSAVSITARENMTLRCDYVFEPGQNMATIRAIRARVCKPLS